MKARPCRELAEYRLNVILGARRWDRSVSVVNGDHPWHRRPRVEEVECGANANQARPSIIRSGKLRASQWERGCWRQGNRPHIPGRDMAFAKQLPERVDWRPRGNLGADSSSVNCFAGRDVITVRARRFLRIVREHGGCL